MWLSSPVRAAVARRSGCGGLGVERAGAPGPIAQRCSRRRRDYAPFVRCPGNRLAPAAFADAFLNAFWNAFSKFFASSNAVICCVIATKRLWRSPPATLRVVGNFCVIPQFRTFDNSGQKETEAIAEEPTCLLTIANSGARTVTRRSHSPSNRCLRGRLFSRRAGPTWSKVSRTSAAPHAADRRSGHLTRSQARV
jgi:hypothetical protein